MKALVLVFLCGFAGTTLAQQKVYRCTVNGQTVYGQAPCKGGAEVAVDDARTEAQRRTAANTQEREEKRLQAAARERERQEARAATQGAAHIPYRVAEDAAKAKPEDKTKLKAAAKKRVPKKAGLQRK